MQHREIKKNQLKKSNKSKKVKSKINKLDQSPREGETHSPSCSITNIKDVEREHKKEETIMKPANRWILKIKKIKKIKWLAEKRVSFEEVT